MRSFFTTALLAAAVAHVQAIKITSPSKNDEVDLSKGVKVEWSTVNTDPTTAHLVLVNQASGHTPYNKDLGEVDLSKGSITVTEKNVPADEGYQFNFESVDKLNTGILAQSEQFEVEASDSDDSDDDDKTSSATSSATSSTSMTKTTETIKTSATKVITSTGESTTVTETSVFPTTLTKTSSPTGTESESPSGTATDTAAPTESTGAAAANAVQGGLFALAAGVVALMA
ncbi:hypothetical protein BT67DRAFT_444591 [Trichocladium antarcticum]|uniref:Yeast cell wall synthesis Kre9/Knh1-like N-terminal domain-containing protein n=1 Tax=Trichocladium antarcticum TaxID=1450529 RepID=A0AAN6UF42_9PEZI|nr:hypothetical protein BT67DRAFT_444591 [Trichocladium antarcticum]